ncbi:MAG TPA: RNA polymerase sigma-70 factor [Chitinophagaceae bacterium]|nr:RNA polymerase sigma-70 factor [Chitinophagaceae bacterium]
MSQNIQNIDKELFLGLSRGDEDAFRTIVTFYHQRFLPTTISLVKSEPMARDIMQEVFLKLWQKREALAEVEHPFTWLKTVVSNTTSNHIRSQLNYELRNKKLISETPEISEIEEDLDAKFTQSLIDEAVLELSPKRKQVFLLSRREGLSRKEIAERLNISENTVRNQLAEAIEFVQNYLRKRGGYIIPAAVLILECSTK